ncbi:MAG: hemolysin family protein [Candidatus Hydrothermarchaeaceae archaeon]
MNLIWIEILGLCVLLSLSAFFSGSEIALFSVNRLRIRKLAEEGVSRAVVLNRLLERPNRLLATILVGNNLVNVGIAAIITSLSISFFGNKGVGIAIGVATLLILVFSEVTPKAFAAKNAERVSLRVAWPISILMKVLYPAVRGIVLVTSPIVRTFSRDMKSPFVTEEEIKMLVEVGEKEGTIEKEEREMINGVFKFGDTAAKEVMVPRIDVSSIESNAATEDAKRLVIDTGYSRTPVYDGSIDNIVGFLFTKDLLKVDSGDVRVKDIMRQAYYVPETKKLDEILDEMQEGKTQMAVVVDEYGGTAGIVTLEDLVEEIVGEILDEKEELPIKIIDDTTALVNAKTSIGDVNETLGITLPEDDFGTVGGLVFNTLGDIPVVGERVVIDNITLTVDKMRTRRVSRVKVIKR